MNKKTEETITLEIVDMPILQRLKIGIGFIFKNNISLTFDMKDFIKKLEKAN